MQTTTYNPIILFIHVVFFASIIAIQPGCAKHSNDKSIKSETTDTNQRQLAPPRDTAQKQPTTPSGVSKFYLALNNTNFKLKPIIDSLLLIQSRMQSLHDDRSKDSLFVIYRNMHQKYQATVCDSFLSGDSVQSYLFSNDTLIGKADSVLKKYGYSLLSTEGMWYIDEESQFMFNHFNKFISEAMKEYLSNRTKEQKEGFSEDAGLLIPFDSVGNRAVTWEIFLSKFPAFILKDEILEWYSTYVRTYLTGMDNSNAFTFNGALEPEVKKSYEQFISKHADTKTGDLVKRWYSFLEARKFKQTTDIDSFLKANDTKSMWATQPPTR